MLVILVLGLRIRGGRQTDHCIATTHARSALTFKTLPEEGTSTSNI